MVFVYRDNWPTPTEQDRQNDIEAAILLTQLVVNLANLGTAEQRRGRNRDGQFVAKPPAIDAQLALENALLAVAKRIKAREESS